jgi:ribosome maturation factor RimP
MDACEKVKALLEAPLSKLGYSLYDVSLAKEKDGLTLHLVVDRDDPISLDDIVKVSDFLNPLLDKEDPIESPYTLDVSSLGAEKPLAIDKLERYVGRYVNIHLSNPYKGENTLEGTLMEVTDSLKLEVQDKSRKKVIVITVKDVDKARLAIKF